MTLPTLSRPDRFFLVGSVLLVILAIAFPVKETFIWRDGQWKRWDTQWLNKTSTDERYYVVPMPPVGQVGRKFTLDERQRRMEVGNGQWDLKELPHVSRMAFDVIFVILAGVGGAYVFRAKA